MDVLRIQGNATLNGTVQTSGAKNACLPVFAATLLTDEPCIIDNVPDLSDIRFMAKILEHLGAEVSQEAPGRWRICAKNIVSKAPYDLVRKMRASVCLMGPLIGRMKGCDVSMPGGCVIGPRPIDIHLKGFGKLGCKIDIDSGYIRVDAREARGKHIFLGGRFGSTVTGTANLLMAAVLTPGVTRIESAACEPEIPDLCEMLVKMGAKIDGIGSHSLIIEGVDKLGGCNHRVVPDRIEAGTYIIGAAITHGDVTVEGIPPHYLGALLDKLDLMGIDIEIPTEDSIFVRGSTADIQPVDIVTMPHPGFPTDLQAQMCALLAVTPGLSIVTEKIYPNRFMHVPELQRMGANIAIEGPSAIINGANRLSGAPVMASDLRASAALVLAGLAAEGETWIQRIYHLDRGYEKLDEKFRELGGTIERLSDKEMPTDLIEA